MWEGDNDVISDEESVVDTDLVVVVVVVVVVVSVVVVEDVVVVEETVLKFLMKSWISKFSLSSAVSKLFSITEGSNPTLML